MREQFSFSKFSPLFAFGLFCSGFFVMSLFLGGVFPLMKARASTGDNVTGWAWSDTIGWISMNNATDGTPNAYGVNIDVSNNISGWAWSENVGWICFGTTCVNEGFTPAPDGMPTWTSVNPVSGEVGGWAKIVSITDETGWIALRNTQADAGSSGFSYGPKVAFADDQDGQNVAEGDMYWWGWSDAIGWIDFGPQVGGNHVGVKTSWTPPPVVNATITPQGGVFEPLCCNGGATTGQACLDQGFYNPATGEGDVYCDDLSGRQGQDLKGTHLHTIDIALSNLPVSTGTVSCDLQLPGRCPGVIDPDTQQIIAGSLCFPSFDSACQGKCGNGAGDKTLSGTIQNSSAILSHTLTPSDSIQKQAFWLLKNDACVINGQPLNFVLDITEPIYTHENSWFVGGEPGVAGDQYPAQQCWRNFPGNYFANTVRCDAFGDLNYAGKQAKGFPVEGNCEDLCTYSTESDEGGLKNCGNPNFIQYAEACCTPNGKLDNDGNSNRVTGDWRANDDDGYCKGIVYPRIYTPESTPCLDDSACVLPIGKGYCENNSCKSCIFDYNPSKCGP